MIFVRLVCETPPNSHPHYIRTIYVLREQMQEDYTGHRGCRLPLNYLAAAHVDRWTPPRKPW